MIPYQIKLSEEHHKYIKRLTPDFIRYILELYIDGDTEIKKCMKSLLIDN